ncbi:hypothetical protein GCM10008083_19210 [Ulvibacter litoralis]|nr:hypothetical protein GCM10008083_19210 [Ulvibacter litoralis]
MKISFRTQVTNPKKNTEMKNIKILFTVLILAVVAVSCDRYDDAPSEFSPIIGFTTGESIITIRVGDNTGTSTVNLFVTDVSDSDRTFTLSVVPEGTELTNASYSFEPSVVIPAGERQTTFTFTAIDVDLTDETKTVVVGVDPVPGLTIGQKMNFELKTRN